jgi:APA family basic amino acid/polyamine antiporter
MLFLVGRAGSIAALATGFTDYLAHFLNLGKVFYAHTFHISGLTYTFTLGVKQFAAIVLVVFLTVINYFGVRTGGMVQTFFTLLKVAIIVLLVLLGFTVAQGSFSHFTPLLPSKHGAGLLTAFGIAMLSALWAYDGWNNVTMVAGEVENPAKNVPRALVFGTASVIAIYLLANLVYIYILPIDTIKNSPRVAATAAESFLGRHGASFFTTAVLISIFAALNGSILSGARVYYAMAIDKLFFRKVASLHPVYRTPALSLMAQSVLAALLIPTGTYDDLIDCVMVAMWIFYALTTASIFVFRRKHPDLVRPYRLRFYPYIPVLFLIVAAFVLINALYTRPAQSLFGLVLTVSGLLPYYYWRRKLSL